MTAYAVKVVDRKEVAGPYVRLACERHLRDMATAHTRGLTFHLPTMQRALDFFPEVLRLNGGQFEGKPFALLPFQQFKVGSIFGWLRADGTRRFRTAYIEEGKGNGKSPLAAGIGLFCLTNDGEPRAEVYAAATKKDQAMILFRDAVAMVDQSPDLAARILKTPSGPACHNLAYLRNGSWFRAIASEDKQSGPRPHCFLIDEVHEHPDATVVNMASAGRKWRRQPLTVEITNSGFDKTSICYEHHAYSIAVLNAKTPRSLGWDDEWFAYVCALDTGDEPLKDESVWIKANPALGKIIKRSYIRGQLKEAKGMPSKRSTVKRLNFCMWTSAENPWIEQELWEACEREFDLIETLKQCPRVVGALDLSGTTDLTALGLGGEFKDGRVVAGAEFWTPDDTIDERSAIDHVHYREWKDEGYLHATPGRAVDYAFVAQRLVEVQQMLPQFREVAFDPYRIKYLEKELDAIGAEFVLVPHPQGYYKSQAKKDEHGEEEDVLWMPRSIELLSKDVSEGKFVAQANPVLRWNSASAVLESDAKNNAIFTKRKSTGRIDGIVAVAMVRGLLAAKARGVPKDINAFLNAPLVA